MTEKFRLVYQQFGESPKWEEKYFDDETTAVNVAKALYDGDKQLGVLSDITVFQGDSILWCLGDYASKFTDGKDMRPCYVKR